MKNLILLTIAILLICSCSKEDSVLPQEEICKLLEFTNNRTLPSQDNYSFTIDHFEDSIVNMQYYDSGTKRVVYKKNEDNSISYTYTDVGTNELASYGTYYLNQAGFIDSFVRRNGATDEVNYRAVYERNSNNQIVKSLSSYITYGHEKTYYFDGDGNYTYSIDVGQGTQTYNDSSVYTYDISKLRTGSPTYITEELEGKKSTNHITGIKSYRRTDGTLRMERKYTFNSFDSEGNPTSIKYELDTNADGISFDVNYSYNRTFSYNCN